MIDIHCHILYGVDDGAQDEQTSRAILHRMAETGVTDVIVTPHFRRHMFAYPKAQIEDAFQKLASFSQTLGIRLYPGCEYHVDHDIFSNLENGRVHTLADTRYVLTEYSYGDALSRIIEYTQELVMRGYQPVIAHAERYEVFQRRPKFIEDVLDAGAMVQVNANSILGLDGWGIKRTARKLMDLDAVDLIASDAHNTTDRAIHMEECREFVSRQYGGDRARELFEEAARRILDESGN